MVYTTTNYPLTRIFFEYVRPGKKFEIGEIRGDTGAIPTWKEFTPECKPTLPKEDQDALTALELLHRATISEDTKALLDAVKSLLPRLNYPPNIDVAEAFKSPEAVRQLYSHVLNEVVREAQLFVEADHTVSIRCPNMRVAAYVFASFGTLRRCPGCLRLFAINPEHPDQKFHKGCAQKVYQREYRKRKKSKRRK
jgi:hypothetical protein